jgi:hypothetical protein
MLGADWGCTFSIDLHTRHVSVMLAFVPRVSLSVQQIYTISLSTVVRRSWRPERGTRVTWLQCLTLCTELQWLLIKNFFALCVHDSPVTCLSPEPD